MKIINAMGACLSPVMVIALAAYAESNGLLKSDLRWRMGVAAACSVQVLFLMVAPDGVATTQEEISRFLESGDGNPPTFLGIKKITDAQFDGIQLEVFGGGPVIGRITNLAIPNAIHNITESA